MDGDVKYIQQGRERGRRRGRGRDKTASSTKGVH